MRDTDINNKKYIFCPDALKRNTGPGAVTYTGGYMQGQGFGTFGFAVTLGIKESEKPRKIDVTAK